MSDLVLKDKLSYCSNLVQKKIAELLPKDFSDSQLVAAMRYSATSEGKRIRPFLLMCSAEIFGVKADIALNAAVAIEFVHTYSLIHDDLPAMDDDNYRRGQLTCHRKFDEATAILAGDALLTFAFELLSDVNTHPNAEIRCELVSLLAKSAGFMGMVGGQMIDIEKHDQKISEIELRKLHHLKTGELFIASAEIGAALGLAEVMERQSLRNYATEFGLIFQLKDDILDCKIDDEINAQQTKQKLAFLKAKAISHLKIFGDKAGLLLSLLDFIIEREG